MYKIIRLQYLNNYDIANDQYIILVLNPIFIILSFAILISVYNYQYDKTHNKHNDFSLKLKGLSNKDR